MIINRKLAVAVGIFLAFPATYFILISLLKYSFGLPYLFDTSQSLLETLGIKKSLGWNINLLILFGPLIALTLNLIAVLKIESYNERKIFSIKVSIEKYWWNMMLVVISGILLSTLFFYAIGENCRC